MRRLWANISIACACLVAAFAATPGVIKQISSNGDFQRNRQFTFELSERKQVEGEADPAKLNSDSAFQVASIMENRLSKSGITSYKVSTSGNNMINVSFHADTETQYQQITTFLSFSGSFALVNTSNDLVTADKFLAGAAHLDTPEVNKYPTVLIPVDTNSEEYKQLIQHARENPTTKEASSEDEEPTSTYDIILLYNYEKGDTYDTLKESGKLEEKTFMTFDAGASDDAGTLYYNGVVDSNGRANFFRTCGFQDLDGDGVASASEVAAAYDLANYYVNLFNASSIDYEVKLIKGLTDDTKVWVDPYVEGIVNNQLKLQMNATLISIIAAIIVVALLLVVFYRLGALNIMTITILGTFLTFLFVTLMGLEYTTITVVAFCLVALTSLISGVIYCNKLKEESYRGRSLKKANAEASKKSLLPIVDVHIVSLLLGILLFSLGGSAVHGFGGILILGSLISFVLSTLGLKGLMWLATNTTGLIGKYQAFGIDPKNVPNHMAEEKQRYFGSYADKDPTKRKKVVSIIGGAAFVVSLIGIIVASSLGAGNLYKDGTRQITGSEMYVVNKIELKTGEEVASFDEDKIVNLLGNIVLYNAGDTTIPDAPSSSDTHDRLSKYYDGKTIKSFTIQESEVVEGRSGEVKYLLTYYQLNLTSHVDGDKLHAKLVGLTISDDITLNQLLDNIALEEYGVIIGKASDVSNTISLNTTTILPRKDNVEWNRIVLAVFIVVVVLTVYFILRYRISRGLAMLIYPLVSSAITLGIFLLVSLMGPVVPASISLLLPITTLLSFAFMILIANRERELILEDKVRDNTFEHRKETGLRALGMALTPMFVVLILGIYLMINFFGFGPAINSYIYLASLISILISFALIAITYLPLSNLVFNLFAKIRLNKKPRKKKKKEVSKNKSGEPEEAIFIGIND